MNRYRRKYLPHWLGSGACWVDEWRMIWPFKCRFEFIRLENAPPQNRSIEQLIRVRALFYYFHSIYYSLSPIKWKLNGIRVISRIFGVFFTGTYLLVTTLITGNYSLSYIRSYRPPITRNSLIYSHMLGFQLCSVHWQTITISFRTYFFFSLYRP